MAMPVHRPRLQTRREPVAVLPDVETRTRPKQTPRRNRADLRRSAASFSAMIFLIVCAVYFLTPFCWLVITATKSSRDLITTFGFWFAPHFNLFTNLQRVFTIDHAIFVQWLLNTLLYAGVGTLIGTFLASMVGYALAKYSFPGRSFIFSIILGAVLVPSSALALPLYLLMVKWNMTNTYWSVLLPGIVSPFGVYLSRIYVTASVPDELLEAARLDGASEFYIFVVVAMPLMAPALVTILLFQFVTIWNNYFLPLIMLNNEQLFPLTVGLRNWGAPSLVVPGVLVSMLPLLIGCAFLQRFWRVGLGTGSIKA